MWRRAIAFLVWLPRSPWLATVGCGQMLDRVDPPGSDSEQDKTPYGDPLPNDCRGAVGVFPLLDIPRAAFGGGGGQTRGERERESKSEFIWGSSTLAVCDRDLRSALQAPCQVGFSILEGKGSDVWLTAAYSHVHLFAHHSPTGVAAAASPSSSPPSPPDAAAWQENMGGGG